MQRVYRFLAVVIIAAAFLQSYSFAQKRQYTMAEATNGITTTLAPASVKGPGWYIYALNGQHYFYQVTEDKNGQQDWQRIAIPSGKAENEGHFSYLIDSLKTIPQIKWSESPFRTPYFRYRDTLYFGGGYGHGSIEMESHFFWQKLAVLPHKADNLTFLNASFYAFTVDNNLYFGRLGNYKQITQDINPNIINGQAVHRNEFGIDKGIFFSPRGSYLAYYRMDQTMVEDYPVIDWSVTPAKNENVKYPMAGRKSHEVTLQVYNIATQQTTAIKTEGPKDQYLTCVTWSPDEKYIYIAILNRAQNHLWLREYDARTGVGTRRGAFLQETDDKYVEPQHPLSFLPGSNTRFIWWSQRDGYMHLWLCDMAKNSMRCLTPGAYVVNDLIGFNARTNEVLLTSAKESPLDKHGYAVNWETGKMRELDGGIGIHNYTASDDGKYLFDVFTAERYSKRYDWNWKRIGYSGWVWVGTPIIDAKQSVIRSINGDVIKVLMESPNPLEEYERPEIIETNLKLKDSTFLIGKLILPTNFDATKKYPVIVYLYNGPHVQLVKNGFPASGNLWYEYLAQHGYIVWTMDGRGSSNRGLKFEQATFRKLGTVEMEDQLKGVEFLKSLPYVDTTRMGVHGWSFGGFMTTSLMLRHPGVFKCAVAGGPVMDWGMYEVMYGERYMDMPEENPEGYKESALFDKVKNLKGKLLLIHGTQDATVVWQNSVKFLKACVDNGVQVDYFIYPGYEHNVRGKDRVHLMQKITDYFDQCLK